MALWMREKVGGKLEEEGADLKMEDEADWKVSKVTGVA